MLNMIKIPLVGKKLDNSLKIGEIKLAHWHNGNLCWATKNLVKEVRYFDLNAPWPSKIVVKFAKSRSFLY